MRIIFYTILFTTGLFLSLLIIAPSFFDINTYKAKLYKLVENQTGYILDIKGKIGISLFPRLKLNAENIKLSNKKEILFYAKNLIIYPSLFSMLKGDLYFDSIKLDTAEILIRKDVKGQYNWNILDKEKKTSTQSNHKEEEEISINKENTNNFFIIKNLNLKNSKILYENKDKPLIMDKIFVNLKQNIENSYKLDGSFSLDSKPIVFKYSVELAENYINFDGKLKSNNFELNNKGKYIFPASQGEFYINGNLKNLVSITKVKDLKINELYLSAILNLSKDNLKIDNIELSANSEKLYGNANMKIIKDKMYVDAKLNSEALNFNNIYSVKEKKKNASDQSENKKKDNINEPQNNKLDIFKITRDINLNTIIQVKNMIYKDVNLDNVELKVKKKNDIKLGLEAFNFFNSKLDLNLTLNEKMAYSFVADLKDFDLKKLNSYYKVNMIHGNLDLSSSLKGKLVSDNHFLPIREVLFNSKGISSISARNLVLKNINLKDFNKSVKNLSKIDQLKSLKSSLLEGDSDLGSLKIKVIHEKDTLKLPVTNLNIEGEPIAITGKYNMKNRNIELETNYLNDNSFLSLFSIRTKGKISSPSTSISFDNNAVTSVLKKLAEKEIKKSLEKKLEKKFDNILENLLEEL
tara:strand:+ start:368 stop:2275 length:1908 start_codon:yes stop_codon:yes gene_type:complete